MSLAHRSAISRWFSVTTALGLDEFPKHEDIKQELVEYDGPFTFVFFAFVAFLEASRRRRVQVALLKPCCKMPWMASSRSCLWAVWLIKSPVPSGDCTQQEADADGADGGTLLIACAGRTRRPSRARCPPAASGDSAFFGPRGAEHDDDRSERDLHAWMRE